MAAWLDRDKKGWLGTPRPAEPPAEPAIEIEITETVIYHVICCPACKSKDTHVTSTRGTIRHHKCRSCGVGFKSVEQ